MCKSSGFSYLEDFLDDLPISRLEVIWKSSGLLGSLLTKLSGLPGSRLDFQEVVWTSRKSSGLHESLLTKSPFHNRSERFVVWKSSGLLGSLLTKSSGLPVKSSRLPVKSSGLPVKSSELPKSLLTKSSELSGSRLDFLEVFWSCLLKWNLSLSL
ncbi:hypothetical protein YC2023_057332 [Brassica napus]